MIFHENRLLAEDSQEISYLNFVKKKNLGKMSQNLSSAAVVICALRVKCSSVGCLFKTRTVTSRYIWVPQRKL